MKSNRKVLEGGKVRASFTVEAAVLIPMILFLIAGSIQISYDMFGQSRVATKIHEEYIKLNPVRILRRNTVINGLISQE